MKERIAELVALGAATDVQLDEFGEDAVYAAKSSGPQLMSSPVTEKVDRDGGLYRFLLSTEEVNRRGDIIRQGGLDFRNWERNPVVLHNHDDSYPIGLGRVVRDGPRTWLDIQFSEVNPNARLVRALTDEGLFRAASISIMPSKVGNPRDPKEREKLGLGKYGVEYQAAEVIEGSIVTIPADPAAVRNALLAREVDEPEADRFVASMRPTERDLVKRLRVGRGDWSNAPEYAVTATGNTWSVAPFSNVVTSGYVEIEPAWVARLEASLERHATRIEHAIRTSARREPAGSDAAASAGGGIPLSQFLTNLNQRVQRLAQGEKE